MTTGLLINSKAKLHIIFQTTKYSAKLFSFFSFNRKKTLSLHHKFENMKKHEVIISLASNENQEANLEKAREQLTQLLEEVCFTSAIWTEPINTTRKEPYLNQLCKGTTAFGDGLLGEILKETEKRIGRVHNEDGIVVIDLDLLEFDGQKHHLRDWNRDYVKNLISELTITD